MDERDLGHKQEVSDGELLALCNLAYLGCLHVFATICTDDVAEQAAARREQFMEQIRVWLDRDGLPDGLHRLTQSCVAILRAGRLAEYLIPEDDEDSGEADENSQS